MNDNFWTPIQNLIVDVVLPYQYDILDNQILGAEKSNAIQNFRIAAGKADGEFYGMVFQDSDVAKWLEAAAYALSLKPDDGLERKADELIKLIGQAQESDGYLNTYFQIKEPAHKWQNLLECHELYCAGHMIEAAVAYFETTGKDEFLTVMRRNADLICGRFGEGKKGIPGHQEIELALYRLYKVTNEKKYLQTALHFLNERGKSPSYFDEELAGRDWQHWGVKSENRAYAQNHLPVREQTEAVGHAVRAVYMYTAMAAVAAQTGDGGLLSACKTLWDNIVNKRMYITGGIGSTHHMESFTVDYDLPNDTVYAETCASVAMVFFARKMLDNELNGEYADIMERELYNGVLSGMQLDGKKFFYVNPLEVVPGVSGELPGYKHALPKRPEWFGCACCPPNVARLIASLGRYAWSETENDVCNHLYLGGTAEFKTAGGVTIETTTNYPWDNTITYKINTSEKEVEFTFSVRVPKWSGTYGFSLNGEPLRTATENGYAHIKRRWQNGDKLILSLSMKPKRVYANTKVRADAACVALMRGPVVYCFEECDNTNTANLSALRLPRASEITEIRGKINTTDVIILQTDGIRVTSDDKLYGFSPPSEEKVKINAVPYYAWGNRESGEMRVWIYEWQ